MSRTEVLEESRVSAAAAPGLWLDRRDSGILKALAIVAIVFHNFFHPVSPAQQNEFTFDPARFGVLIHTLLQPELAIQALFSFFGHFGVQVFIFISAYGLAQSHWDKEESWFAFVSGRVKKVYPAFGIVVAPWFLSACIQHGAIIVVKTIGLQIALMFVGLSTFLPGAGLPPVGPWWFIPFIIQFYALWPLLSRFVRRFGGPGLILLAIVSMMLVSLVNPALMHWQISLLETPIGRMPSICIGIAAARYGLRIPGWLAAVALPTLLMASRNAVFWRLASSAALVLFLWTYLKTRDQLRRRFWLVRLGEYSLVIFLVNGIVRDHLVRLASTPLLQIALAVADLLICIAIAALLQPVLASARPRCAATSPA